MLDLPGLSVNSAPTPKSALGKSFAGFFLTMAVGASIVVAMELGDVGGSLVVAWAVLLLLLPLGVDSRLAGWAIATALPTVLHAISFANEYTPACMPVGDSSVTSGCVVHIGWAWVAVASALVIGGIALMVAVLRRRSRTAKQDRSPTTSNAH